MVSTAALNTRAIGATLTGLVYASVLVLALDARIAASSASNPIEQLVPVRVIREAPVTIRGERQAVQSALVQGPAPLQGTALASSQAGDGHPSGADVTRQGTPWPFEIIDVPGGDMTVLALLVNDRGVVLEAQIAVMSAWPLNDMTLALAAQGMHIDSIYPPLAPGEQRWIPLRIASRDDGKGLIP